MGVTSLAFLLSIIIVIFNLAKWLKWKSTLTPEYVISSRTVLPRTRYNGPRLNCLAPRTM